MYVVAVGDAAVATTVSVRAVVETDASVTVKLAIPDAFETPVVVDALRPVTVQMTFAPENTSPNWSRTVAVTEADPPISVFAALAVVGATVT